MDHTGAAILWLGVHNGLPSDQADEGYPETATAEVQEGSGILARTSF